MMKKTAKETGEIHDWGRIIEIHAALHVRYPQGELIYQAGSYAAGIYIVSTGLVCERLATTSHPDRRLKINCEILGAGDLIGFETVISTSGNTYLTTARAITETDLFFFERAAFQKLLETEISLPAAVLSYLSHRLLDFKHWVNEYYAPLQHRVCHLLLMLASKCGTTLQKEITSLPKEITPAVLAEILDVSKKNVLRALNALPEIRWDEDRLTLSPEALYLWKSTASEEA